MKLFGKILFLALVLDSLEGTLSSFENVSTTATPEPEKKSELFYQAFNESLRNSSEYKLYPERINCIIKKLKSRDTSYQLVNESLYNFDVNSEGQFKAKILNHSGVMQSVVTQFDEFSFNCTIGGYIAIAANLTLLIIIISCVVCLSDKNQKIPDE